MDDETPRAKFQALALVLSLNVTNRLQSVNTLVVARYLIGYRVLKF